MLEIALLLAFLSLIFAAVAVHTASTATDAVRRLERRLRALQGAEHATATVDRPLETRRAVPPPAVTPPAEATLPPPPVPPPLPAAVSPLEPEPEPTNAAAPAHRSLEHRIGASLPVWFGAVALALAGIFLVKHFIERGLLGPAARTVLATLLGIALLGIAVPMRRRSATIAQGLAGAGVAVLSAAVYAATALYGFLTPVAGIAAQAVVTAVAVVASLRLGPFVALLGLAGGFVIPALVGPGAIRASTMFGYLMLLQAALAFIGRRQGWWWVPVLGALGAFAWAFGWQELRNDGAPIVSAFLFATAAIAVVVTRGVRVRPAEGLPEVATAMPWVAVGAALALLVRNLDASGTAFEHWAWLYATAIGTLVIATRERRLVGLPWLAAAVVGLRLVWQQDFGPTGADGSLLPVRAWAIATYGLVFGVGGHLAAGTRHAHHAALAWLPPVATFGALCAARNPGPPSAVPGLIAATLAVAFAAGMPRFAAPDARGERESALWTAALVALTFVIHDGLAVDVRVPLLGLVPIAAAVLHATRALPRLAPVATAATVWLLWMMVADHARHAFEVATPIWNAAFLATATTAASIWITSRVLHHAVPDAVLAYVHQALGTAVTALAVSVAVWQVVFDLEIPDPDFLLTAWLSFTWLVLGQALWWTAPRWAIRGRSRPGAHLTVVALCCLVLFCMLGFDPLLSPTNVGSLPILNGLTVAFGAGGVLALLAARGFSGTGARLRGRGAAMIAFACGFLLVTLQLRHAFHGDPLHGAETGRGEWYGYSAAWLVYGGVLLAVGVTRDHASLRHASLLVVLAAVLKVFLLDASHLDGLWRVASFFGLGVALIGLAWVYQRFVVTREPSGAAAA